MENRETIEKIDGTEIWFLKKINKIDKPLVRLTEKTQTINETNKLESYRVHSLTIMESE